MNQIAPRKAVVIVEDNQPVAQLIRDTLNGEPCYHGVVVNDGREALDVIHSIEVSVVLLDVSLPGMSGLELYDRLRSDPALSKVPVIFVTANHDSPELARRGITNVIPKPFNLDELISRVDMACQGMEPTPPAADAEGEVVLDARLHDLRDITYFLTSAG